MTEKKTKAKKEYVNNEDFVKSLIDYKKMVAEAKENDLPSPRIPNYIGECFLKIAEGLSHKPNFINYTYRDEMIADAQNRIGASRYRAAKKVFGPYPTAAEREQLASYREYLNNKYPGFPARAEFVSMKFINEHKPITDDLEAEQLRLAHRIEYLNKKYTDIK